MAKVRFAVITDIHYGPDAGAKYGSKAGGLLDVFTKAAAGYDLDFVADMGDRVTAHDHDEAKQNMQSVKDYFNRLAVPTYNVVGNHDLLHLTREENEQIMGNPGTSYSRDVKDYHFVFWNPPLDLGNSGLHMSKDEMDWLRNDLASTDRPTVIFSHVPLDNDAADNKSGHAASGSDRLYFFYPEGEAIRKIMEDSGKVILAMAGHRHTNRAREMNGIHYVTQQSLVQAWDKHYRKPHRAWSVVEIDDDAITVRLKGRAPMRLQGAMLKKFTLVPRTSPNYKPPEPDAAEGSAPIMAPDELLPKPDGPVAQESALPVADAAPSAETESAGSLPENQPAAPAAPEPPRL
jgi:3',5'-cyclic-AMP phosphodiesterase